jgi:hypothetical protein
MKSAVPSYLKTYVGWLQVDLAGSEDNRKTGNDGHQTRSITKFDQINLV